MFNTDDRLSLRKDENNGDYQVNEHITRLSCWLGCSDFGTRGAARSGTLEIFFFFPKFSHVLNLVKLSPFVQSIFFLSSVGILMHTKQ